jgi:hypothetical protein
MFRLQILATEVSKQPFSPVTWVLYYPPCQTSGETTSTVDGIQIDEVRIHRLEFNALILLMRGRGISAWPSLLPRPDSRHEKDLEAHLPPRRDCFPTTTVESTVLEFWVIWELSTRPFPRKKTSCGWSGFQKSIKERASNPLDGRRL